MPKFNYVFQEKDDRDHISAASISEKGHTKLCVKRGDKLTAAVVPKLPLSYMPSKLGNILDQGNLGTCVANAFQYTVSVQTNKAAIPSRLMLYAIARCIDGTSLMADDGTTVRTACQELSKYGCCAETLYPYIEDKYSLMPPMSAFIGSKLFRQFKYSFINQDLASLKAALFVNKCPIIFGISVYDSFMTDAVAATGTVPMPDKVNETNIGGHCIVMVGYSDSAKVLYCVNSWGTSWGNRGTFSLPYDYVMDSDLAGDFCVLSIVV